MKARGTHHDSDHLHTWEVWLDIKQTMFNTSFSTNKLYIPCENMTVVVHSFVVYVRIWQLLSIRVCCVCENMTVVVHSCLFCMWEYDSCCPFVFVVYVRIWQLLSIRVCCVWTFDFASRWDTFRLKCSSELGICVILIFYILCLQPWMIVSTDLFLCLLVFLRI